MTNNSGSPGPPWPRKLPMWPEHLAFSKRGLRAHAEGQLLHAFQCVLRPPLWSRPHGFSGKLERAHSLQFP